MQCPGIHCSPGSGGLAGSDEDDSSKKDDISIFLFYVNDLFTTER